MIEVVVCPYGVNLSKNGSSSSMLRSLTFRNRQSSPVIRWHSTTSGDSTARSRSLSSWRNGGSYPHDRREGVTDRDRVDVSVVAAYRAALLQAPQSLGDRGPRKGKPAREVGDADATVGLHLAEDPSVDFVERGQGVRRHGVAPFELHTTARQMPTLGHGQRVAMRRA